MGVRIGMYAADIEQLKVTARLPLRAIMQRYSEQSCTNQSEPPHMHFITDGLHMVRYLRYHARPGQGIRRQNKPITSEEITQDSFLSTSLSAYFAQDSSIGLRNLFNCLSYCPDENRIHRITWRYRRWWMGSFLDYAENFYGESSATYTGIVAIFQKILRGNDCGKILKKDDTIRPFEPDFPLIPGEDEDTRMAVLNDAEMRLLVQVMHEVPESTMFHAPPGRTGIAPETDEDWNAWVWLMINELRVLETLKNQVSCLITFIG